MLGKDEMGRSYQQSRYYRAPEVLLGCSTYTTAVDMWSLGCIMVELFAGQTLFKGSCHQDQMVQICTLLGLPPTALLRSGAHTDKFFSTPENGGGSYKLLSIDKQKGMRDKLAKKERGLPDWCPPEMTPGERLALREPSLSSLAWIHKGDLASSHEERHSFVDVIKALLRWTPERRVSADMLLEHCFWTKTALPRSQQPGKDHSCTS